MKNKADKLNILRFCAFMMVFLLHAKGFIPVEWNENCKMAWMLYTPAWAGTWIFFVLSGYGTGAGFYLGKYEHSMYGVGKYYCKRLAAVIPIYWFWIVTVAVFVKPEILQPSAEHMKYLLKLFFFDYQEEFYPLEFGVGWYMTTLMRLYLIAPAGYFLFRRFVKSQEQTCFMLLLIVCLGFVSRCLMGYHMEVTGEGVWTAAIYKPFYFNLDFFFTGMLLNSLKNDWGGVPARRNKKKKVLSVLGLCTLILVNSYIYYNNDYKTTNYMELYYYVFPSIYLILTACYIDGFEIHRGYTQTELTVGEFKKNPMRIFDFFPNIQFPAYLFHNSILLCLANAYDENLFLNICRRIMVPEEKYHFVIGCIFTVMALAVSMIWSVWTHCIVVKKNRRCLKYFEKWDISAVNNQVIRGLQKMFPLS